MAAAAALLALTTLSGIGFVAIGLLAQDCKYAEKLIDGCFEILYIGFLVLSLTATGTAGKVAKIGAVLIHEKIRAIHKGGKG